MSDADEIQTLHALNDSQAAEIARLTAENAELRKDAERWRESLHYIAVADTRGWDDPSDASFKAWAQSRARFAIDAARGEP